MTISVIIPAYNVANVIETCLRSLLQQDQADFECIIVDDASTDGTGDVIHRVASADRRFRVVTNSRTMGPSHTRNTALTVASGSYVMFVDADDWIDASALAQLLDFTEAHALDYCFSSHDEYVERRLETRKKNPRLLESQVFAETDLSAYVEKYVDSPCDYYGLVHCWGRLYKRSIIVAKGVEFDPSLCQMEDVSFNFRYLLHCERVGFIDGYVYTHRIPAKGSLGSSKGVEPDFDVKLLQAITPIRVFLVSRMRWTDEDAIRRLDHFYSSMTIVSILRLSRIFFSRPTFRVYRRIRTLIVAAATQRAIRCYRPGERDSRFMGVAIRWRLPVLALVICLLKRTFRVAL